MFRVYRLPREFDGNRFENRQNYFAKKRLLNAHAARVSSKKLICEGRSVEHLHYLMISALALDTAPGSCAALSSSNCSIYERRPLACRTVPLHYARDETLAEQDFDDFVSTPGYRCNVGESAPALIENGTVVDPSSRATRAQATHIVERDAPWKAAILRAMRSASDGSLPRPEEVEANAPFGAMTTSMRVAWLIAGEAGLMRKDESMALVNAQLRTIERELERGRSGSEDRETLREMAIEYRRALRG